MKYQPELSMSVSIEYNTMSVEIIQAETMLA